MRIINDTYAVSMAPTAPCRVPNSIIIDLFFFCNFIVSKRILSVDNYSCFKKISKLSFKKQIFPVKRPGIHFSKYKIGSLKNIVPLGRDRRFKLRKDNWCQWTFFRFTQYHFIYPTTGFPALLFP